mmetsp:Transcript_14945/g.29064  ORF Transcript_14945/g.29064 Transcript_14945/m.29064 type:complete len:262 (+) Transcript_14945:365-1150(+)
MLFRDFEELFTFHSTITLSKRFVEMNTNPIAIPNVSLAITLPDDGAPPCARLHLAAISNLKILHVFGCRRIKILRFTAILGKKRKVRVSLPHFFLVVSERVIAFLVILITHDILLHQVNVFKTAIFTKRVGIRVDDVNVHTSGHPIITQHLRIIIELAENCAILLENKLLETSTSSSVPVQAVLQGSNGRVQVNTDFGPTLLQVAVCHINKGCAFCDLLTKVGILKPDILVKRIHIHSCHLERVLSAEANGKSCEGWISRF